MQEGSASAEVKRGLRRAGAWLLGGAWLGMVFGGMGIAFSPSRFPPAVGWLLLAIAALVLVLTMDRWVRVFPGLMAYGVIGGLLTVVQGHALNNPDIPVPRLEGILMTLVFALSAAVSFTFLRRKLRFSDRVALFVFVFCFFWQTVDQGVALAVVPAGLGCLLLAWSYDRFSAARRLNTER